MSKNRARRIIRDALITGSLIFAMEGSAIAQRHKAESSQLRLTHYGSKRSAAAYVTICTTFRNVHAHGQSTLDFPQSILIA
jgi:hypothetical protein